MLPSSTSTRPGTRSTCTKAATYRYLRTITLDGDMSQMFVVPPE